MKQNIKKEDNYEVTANSKDNIDAEWQMNSSVRNMILVGRKCRTFASPVRP